MEERAKLGYLFCREALKPGFIMTLFLPREVCKMLDYLNCLGRLIIFLKHKNCLLSSKENHQT